MVLGFSQKKKGMGSRLLWVWHGRAGQKNPTPEGFEPSLHKGNALAVRRLNHSARVSKPGALVLLSLFVVFPPRNSCRQEVSWASFPAEVSLKPSEITLCLCVRAPARDLTGCWPSLMCVPNRLTRKVLTKICDVCRYISALCGVMSCMRTKQLFCCCFVGRCRVLWSALRGKCVIYLGRARTRSCWEYVFCAGFRTAKRALPDFSVLNSSVSLVLICLSVF